jgi:putative membrane protein
MSTAALVATYVVAALHLVFFALESVLWTTPKVRKIFGQTQEEAETTKVLALNQGAYNAGLAAALVYAAVVGSPDILVVLHAFIIAMGVVGAATAKPTILFLQALPAAIALALLLI